MPEMIEPAQLHDAADDLAGLPGVVATDVLDRDPRVQRPLLEITVGPRYERVPPRVLRKIAEHDLGTRSITPRPEGHFVVEVL